jgi:hypothetical protein
MTAPWPKKPFLYEINTWVWLNSLTDFYKRPITLADIPDPTLNWLSSLHIDAVWLMGIWQRSAAACESARNYMHEYRPVLPDLTPDDVIGSAYAIGDYRVDDRLGGREGLAHLRARLAERGIRLILDFVPNHVACDHPWALTRPDAMICASAEDAARHPGLFYPATNGDGDPLYVAHGRDPHFPPWIDTAQVNAFSPAYRHLAVETLRDIAAQCDGVRCDMAMLMTNTVFNGTWGQWAGPMPAADFWPEVIAPVKADYPGFLFMAEVYWGMEFTMLQQGFDYTYDKVLYDRVMAGYVSHVRDHLRGPLTWQERQVHFIENHDEPRAASSLGIERSRPAAVLIATLPGATLLHDGQFTGRTIKLPVQIARQPGETPFVALEQFYQTLLKETRAPVYQHGRWQMFAVNSAHDFGVDRHGALLAYGWRHDHDARLIVVNLTGLWAQGAIDLEDWYDLVNERWCLHEVLRDTYYFYRDEDFRQGGLVVDLEPHQAYIYRFVVTGRSRAATKAAEPAPEAPTEAPAKRLTRRSSRKKSADKA